MASLSCPPLEDYSIHGFLDFLFQSSYDWVSIVLHLCFNRVTFVFRLYFDWFTQVFGLCVCGLGIYTHGIPVSPYPPSCVHYGIHKFLVFLFQSCYDCVTFVFHLCYRVFGLCVCDRPASLSLLCLLIENDSHYHFLSSYWEWFSLSFFCLLIENDSRYHFLSSYWEWFSLSFFCYLIENDSQYPFSVILLKMILNILFLLSYWKW